MDSQFIRHYRILKKLGEGGMGEVYLAEDTRLHRKVAIKLLAAKTSSDPQAAKRLIREAQAAAKLTHDNICRIYEIGEENGIYFIVMEYIEGETLAERISRQGLTLSTSVHIAIQVSDALGEAHSKGIIHRDIKPQNVIINSHNKVKILDFGLAKIVPLKNDELIEGDTASALTGAGVIMGTAPYMSPEQAKGTAVDARSDLFSMGAMLYECVTGARPFTGSNRMEICAQVLYVTPPAPSKINARVPAELDKIILQALEKNASARFQKAEQMLSELRGVQQRLTDEEQLKTPPAPHRTDTSLIGAFKTLVNTVRHPSARQMTVAVSLLLVFFAILVITKVYLPAAPQTLSEAERWYAKGLEHMRDGAYYQASKAFEVAINANDKFVLAHARLAEAWYELDHTDKASFEWARVTELVPDRSKLPQLDRLYLQSINFTLTRNFAAAVETCREIVRRTPDKEKPQAYVDLGRAYEKNEELEKAFYTYQQSLKLDKQNAAAFLHCGILCTIQQKFSDAETHLNEAQTLYQTLGTTEGQAEALYQHGSMLNQMGKRDEAKADFQKVLNLARDTDNKYQQIRSMLQLSSVYYLGGDTAQAKELADQALKIAMSNSLENLATQGLLDLGYAFYMRRSYDEARQYFLQALDFARRYKGRRNEARALFCLGSADIQQEKPVEGLAYIEQALSFYQEGGYRKQIAECLMKCARTRLLMGEYETAIALFADQVEVAKHVQAPAQIASSQTEFASALAQQERYPQALYHYDESLAINRSLDNPLGMGYDLLNRADMLARLGRYDEARASLTELAQMVLRIDQDNRFRKLWAAYSLLLEAQMALSEKNFPEAKNKAQQAVAFALTPVPPFESTAAMCKATLGLAQVFSGELSAGEKHCTQALEMAVKVMNADKYDPRVLANSKLALAEVLLEKGDIQDALTYAVQAQEGFAGTRQQESEWRAWLIAGLANQKAGNYAAMNEKLLRADTILRKLQVEWGEETSIPYLDRPDIKDYRKDLQQALALKK
jgi:serine/threonine protein kinase